MNMGMNPAILRVQIPAPPFKPLDVPRGTILFFAEAIGVSVSAYWRQVLDRTFATFGWQASWQASWQARQALLARLASYTPPDPDVAYQRLVDRLRQPCTESSAQTLDQVDADH
jgi:hypothetical protein